MSRRRASPDSPGGGATTAAAGTPYPVDLTRDRRGRTTWIVFLSGPIIWFAHFMVVYLVAEAGCTGDGHGLELFDPPVPRGVTLAATVAAVLACLGVAAWAHRRWRGIGEDLAFPGMLLSLLSALTVLAVGLSAVFLVGC